MESYMMLLLTNNFYALNSSLQEKVFRDFYQYVYTSIYYMTKDHAATEDIVQEAFLSTINKVPYLDNEKRLKAWIRTTAKNTTYNYLKKNKNNRKELDIDNVFMYEETASYSERIDQQVEAKMLEEDIVKMIHSLNPMNQKIIELRWKRHMSYKEIAEEIGSTEDMVKNKIFRAREMMRKKMKKKWGILDE